MECASHRMASRHAQRPNGMPNGCTILKTCVRSRVSAPYGSMGKDDSHFYSRRKITLRWTWTLNHGPPARHAFQVSHTRCQDLLSKAVDLGAVEVEPSAWSARRSGGCQNLTRMVLIQYESFYITPIQQQGDL